MDRTATPSPFSTLLVGTRTTDPRPPSGARYQARVDHQTWSGTRGERVLVLGGGGAVGNAWLIGVVAGLHDAGVDVTEPDLMIGTSAGSTAAAQITGTGPARLFADIASAPPQPRTDPSDRSRSRVPANSVGDQLRRTGDLIAASDGPADMRRRLGAGALALDAASDESWRERWRATVAARLPSEQWPRRPPIIITAVEAATGNPVVFDRHSGVDLVDAVAASCASGPPYRIGDVAYIDGGYRRSSENADLAAGSGRVLVLSPLGGRTRAPLEWGMHLAVQVDELRAGGSRVRTVLPDDHALSAFGTTLMDLTARPAAAQAGYDQGRGLAAEVVTFWR